MKYDYTDVTNVQIKMSITPWEASRLLMWLNETTGEEDFTRTNIIKTLTSSIECAAKAMAYEAEHVKGYVKTEEDNNA